MPRKKKPAIELTTDEALRRLFPKSVVKRLKEMAHPESKLPPKKKDT
jgi:hypothetical protein